MMMNNTSNGNVTQLTGRPRDQTMALEESKLDGNVTSSDFLAGLGIAA